MRDADAARADRRTISVALYANFAEQNPLWNEIPSTPGILYQWDEESTYIQEPPFFTDFGMSAGKAEDITGARPLAIFGDSVTTDHISPAGSIKASSPAGKYLHRERRRRARTSTATARAAATTA